MNFLSGLFRGTRSLSGGVMRSMPNVGSINEKHHVSGNHMFDFPEDKKSLIFGMGCFWGVERLFWKQPGVWSTQAGYAGGNYPDPTYEQTCRGGKGQHAEVVRVIYDPAETSAETLIKIFWEGHDPTQKDRQGNDRGPQYRSALFVNNQAEYDLAQQTGQNFQKQLKNSGVKGPIATEIKILTEFFYAEDYHQQYLYKNPGGYCSLKGTGVTCA